ncbi:OmpA family protein [uncultured Ruegeria sp.]|uniref:OmpA family protein n=1 Tax=uncultured Ruegeria sp. TaxID=259304 RepID=UPI0026186F57|nr:OmpA family protein [uncultured Ruegeria sp.]
MRFLTGIIGGVCLAVLTLSVSAQEMTPEEINRIFNRQIEVQNQPLTRSLDGSSKARGVSLVTVEDIQAEAVSPESLAAIAPVQTTTAPTVETATTTPDTSTPDADTAATSNTTQVSGVVDPNKPLVYAKLDTELQINLQIKFGYDSAALDQSQKTKLSTMCTAMQTSPIEQFRIIGHTDTSGSDEYNQRLSVLRAKEVARYLVQDCGITPQRLETVGMGERFPVNTNDTKAEENRRVEFQALS